MTVVIGRVGVAVADLRAPATKMQTLKPCVDARRSHCWRVGRRKRQPRRVLWTVRHYGDDFWGNECKPKPVRFSHSDLAHAATVATDGLPDAELAGVPHPHATHVAGIIGARGQM